MGSGGNRTLSRPEFVMEETDVLLRMMSSGGRGNNTGAEITDKFKVVIEIYCSFLTSEPISYCVSQISSK